MSFARLIKSNWEKHTHTKWCAVKRAASFYLCRCCATHTQRYFWNFFYLYQDSKFCYMPAENVKLVDHTTNQLFINYLYPYYLFICESVCICLCMVLFSLHLVFLWGIIKWKDGGNCNGLKKNKKRRNENEILKEIITWNSIRFDCKRINS